MRQFRLLNSATKPSVILERLGFPAMGTLPAGIAVGPFDFKGVLDFDAASESVVCNFLDADNFDAIAFTSRLQSAGESNPKVMLAVSGIEVVFIEQSMLDHADPEDVKRVWQEMYLEAKTTEWSRKWPLRDGCHVDAQPVGLIDSDQATEVRAYRYCTNGLQLFTEGSLGFDLGMLKELAVKCSTLGTASLLGSNADVIVRIHGVAWDANYDGWSDDREHCEKPVSGPEAIMELDERDRKQRSLLARSTLTASRF